MHEHLPRSKENTTPELPEFYEDCLLRREAGEGWKLEEPDGRLFGLLIAREIIMDSMTRAGLHAPVKDERNPDKPAPIYDEYLALIQRIDVLKEDLGITTPPPLPLEQEDEYTT